MKKFIFITLLIIIIDQCLKIYIKTHFKIGDSFPIIGILEMFFVENPGMAFGIYIVNGYLNQIIITSLRIIICIIFFTWTYKNIKKNKSNYFIISVSMIFAGAISNIIDNIFYGMIFDRGMYYSNYLNKWINYYGISKLTNNSYSFFMRGCVVDMISISLKNIIIPKWVPIIGGKYFDMFKPIFNIADISITFGTLLIIFNKKIFNKKI